MPVLSFISLNLLRYITYTSIEAKLTSFMDTIATQLNPQTTASKTNHNYINTNNDKTEVDYNSPNEEKTSITTGETPTTTTTTTTTHSSFLDLEVNGINSPSNDLTLDNFLNDDQSSTIDIHSFSSDDKPNINNINKESHNNEEGNNSIGKDSSGSIGSDGGSKSNGVSGDGVDVVGLVRTQLHSTFKYNSPVNEYGMRRDEGRRKRRNQQERKKD